MTFLINKNKISTQAKNLAENLRELVHPEKIGLSKEVLNRLNTNISRVRGWVLHESFLANNDPETMAVFSRHLEAESLYFYQVSTELKMLSKQDATLTEIIEGLDALSQSTATMTQIINNAPNAKEINYGTPQLKKDFDILITSIHYDPTEFFLHSMAVCAEHNLLGIKN